MGRTLKITDKLLQGLNSLHSDCNIKQSDFLRKHKLPTAFFKALYNLKILESQATGHGVIYRWKAEKPTELMAIEVHNELNTILYLQTRSKARKNKILKIREELIDAFRLQDEVMFRVALTKIN